MGRILSKRVSAIGTFLFFLLLTSCGSTTQQSLSNDDSLDQKSDAITFQAVDGTSVTLDDFGEQPTVLWFWSPHWGRCQIEASTVAEAQKKFIGQVDFVGVAGRSDLNNVKEFITSFDVEEFPHLYDPDGEIWARYGVSSQPAWVFIDSNGEPQRAFGVLGTSVLDDEVQRILTVG